MTGGDSTGPAAAWPREYLESLGRCPVCGEARRRLLHAALADRLFGAPGTWDMYGCAKCGCAYLDPRPTEQGLHLAYRHYYTHEARPDDDPQRGGATVATSLKQAVLRGYIRMRFGRLAPRPSDAAGLLMWLRPRLRRAFDAAVRHLPRTAPGRTLLDIGCGSGRFMAWARTAGWVCEGTEVDAAAAERARSLGFPVHLGSLKELADSGRRYDAVTMSHVIEHVHEPLELLRDARRLLRDGGCFWIETPNADAFGHEIFGPDWRGLEPPRHLQLFTPRALQDLLLAAGFAQVETAPWQLDWAAVASLSRALAGEPTSPGRWASWFGERAEQVGRRIPDRREFITKIATTGPVAQVGRS